MRWLPIRRGLPAGAHVPVQLKGARPRPARSIVLAFAVLVAGSTALLMLPVASESGQGAPFRIALFTAVSASCITGLTIVDTGSYWSTFGEVVILGSVQIGGMGIMVLASLLGIAVSRRMGLRTRLLAQAGTQAGTLGDVRRVVRGVLTTSLAIEAATIVVLAGRFLARGEEPAGRAVYSAFFHGIAAFFNSGFSIYSDSLTRYGTDPWVIIPVSVAVVLGGLGFPVLFELRRELTTPRTWSLHTKLTVVGTGALLVVGAVAVTASEWTNPRTLGASSVGDKLWLGGFQGLTPRSAGFNTVDYTAMHDETWLITDALMFIGGGSAGAGGGIKVTTFMVLVLAIVAEVRGEPDVNAFGRRVPFGAVRQALAVAATGILAITLSTIAILSMTDADLDKVLFDVTSAATTTGLSTGISAELPAAAQYLLAFLMFAGRTGTITMASALALRERQRLYRLPEERPVVG